VHEKKSIQKIKDLFNSEEKYKMYERLYSKETSSSQRKKRAFEEDSAKKSGSAAKNNQAFKQKVEGKPSNSNLLDESKTTHKTIDPCLFLYHKGVQLREEKKKI
jgi:hypothetical protein